MGHTKQEMLADIETELALIRELGGVIEKKPGIFYLKAIPFLHFHDADGCRWADVKKPGGGWVRLDIDFESSSKERGDFIQAARAAYKKLTAAKGKKK